MVVMTDSGYDCCEPACDEPRAESGLEYLGRKLYENMPVTVLVLAIAGAVGALAWGSPSCS